MKVFVYGTLKPGEQNYPAYCEGKAIAEIIIHTRQFAKRQRTWFRAYPEIQWFDATAPDLLEQVWQYYMTNHIGAI